MSLRVFILCVFISIGFGVNIQPWGNAWTMTQLGYVGLNKNDTSTGVYYEKRITYWSYDYNKLSMRQDYWTLRGVNMDLNETSIWINNILYIINNNNGECTKNDMGFGIPRPNWFVDGNLTEYIYLLESRDDLIKRTVHLAKESPGIY